MSNAIGQSATQAAVSGNGEANFDFALHVKDAAHRQSKGITRERRMINRSKLKSSVCAVYRAKFASIYGKTDKLPADINDKIDAAIVDYINDTLKLVNADNAISYRRAFYHNANDLMITERVMSVGENSLTLKEQLLGVDLFIGQAEKRLKELEAKKTPDYDREKAVKAQIMKLNITREFIMGEMKHQGELISQ